MRRKFEAGMAGGVLGSWRATSPSVASAAFTSAAGLATLLPPPADAAAIIGLVTDQADSPHVVPDSRVYDHDEAEKAWARQLALLQQALR